jgi:hypothetical protein
MKLVPSQKGPTLNLPILKSKRSMAILPNQAKRPSSEPRRWENQ